MIRLLTIALLAGLFSAAQGPAGPVRLAWVDRTGKTISQISRSQWFITDPLISPDGTRIAAGGRDLQNEVDHLWIHDVIRGTVARLTGEPAQERHSAWSPKADKLVFYSMRKNNQADLYLRNADGSGEEPLVLSDDRHEYYPSWSPDGRFVTYHTHDPKTDSRDIYYLEITGDRKPRPLLATPAREALARFSPDGKYVTYGSDESGKWEVYVTPFPSAEARWKISTIGGVWPRWNDKGELFFWEGNALMVVNVKPGPAFAVSTPQKLFTGAQAGMGPGEMKDFSPSYDVSRDGTRFLVVQLQN